MSRTDYVPSKKGMLAPMSWQKIPLQEDGFSLELSEKTCLIIPSPPPLLAIYGAPTVHNTADPEKFALLCNMSSEPIEIPEGVIIAYQEVAYDLEKQSSAQIVSADTSPSDTALLAYSDRKQQYRQVDKLKSSND